MNAPVLSARSDLSQPRHDWTLAQVEALFELLFRVAEVHPRWFDPTGLQISQLLSAKTGGCLETA